MTEIKIPEIYIPHIAIPKVYIPHVSLSPADRAPEVETIGCKYFHRDVKNTGNRNLLIDDPNGVVSNCPYPSFIPMNYQADQLIITETALPAEEEQKLPEGKPPKAEIPKEEKKDDVFVECPGKNDQRVGDFRNEKRLERVVGHKRSEDGTICTTIYEDVPFKDQYIPEVSTIVSTAVIGLVAASTPLLLNAVKPLVKQIVKKLTKKKKDLK